MPNHELCRAEWTSRKRPSQIDGAMRHNPSDFRKVNRAKSVICAFSMTCAKVRRLPLGYWWLIRSSIWKGRLGVYVCSHDRGLERTLAGRNSLRCSVSRRQRANASISVSPDRRKSRKSSPRYLQVWATLRRVR